VQPLGEVLDVELPEPRGGEEEKRMNIYVGNLSREVSEQELREAFEAHGQVSSARVIKDRYTGESRGFGFVEMPEMAEARAAMAALKGTEMKGRTLTVNEARPRQDRRREGREPGRGRGGRRW
jgi:RNA recognition motif-containing protein